MVITIFLVRHFFVWILWSGVWHIVWFSQLPDLLIFSGILGKNSESGGQIDAVNSSVVKDSTKLPMRKNVFDGWVETTITAEKEVGFRRNQMDLWKKYGYFKQQACNFSMEKANMPEMTTFYLNQAYQSYKDNKRICYWDLLIFGQVTPFLNPPEDLSNFEVKDDEAKIVRPKYDTVSD